MRWVKLHGLGPVREAWVNLDNAMVIERLTKGGEQPEEWTEIWFGLRGEPLSLCVIVQETPEDIFTISMAHSVGVM